MYFRGKKHPCTGGDIVERGFKIFNRDIAGMKIIFGQGAVDGPVPIGTKMCIRDRSSTGWARPTGEWAAVTREEQGTMENTPISSGERPVSFTACWRAVMAANSEGVMTGAMWLMSLGTVSYTHLDVYKRQV